MVEESVKYSELTKMKAPAFDTENIGEYNLYITFDSYTFSLSVVDTKSNQCMVLESYLFEEINSTDDFIKELDHLYEDHHFLKVNFWKKVIVSVKNKQFSLVPKNLFQENEKFTYLNVNTPCDPVYDEVLSVQQKQDEIVTLFGADKVVYQWLCGQYSKSTVAFTHHTAVLIDAITKDFTAQENKSLFLHIDTSQLNIIIAGENQLTYCNTFDFYSIDDVVALTNYAVEELGFKKEKFETIIWLNSLADLEVVDRLQAEGYSVYMGDRPYGTSFSYVFDELEDYQYFDLLGMHQ